MSTTTPAETPLDLAAPVEGGLRSLDRNARWLLISSAGSAVLGMLYWAVAGHLYSVEQFGRDGAILSAMLGVSAVGQLNLPLALLRLLPALPRRRVEAVVGAFAAVVLASVLSAVVALALLGDRVEGLREATSQPGTAVVFAVGAAMWSLFVLQDTVLVALRRSVWVPVENITFGALKIGFAVLFVDSLGGFGIIGSWLVALAVVLVPVNLWTIVLTARSRRDPVRGSPVLTALGRRGVLRMNGLDYGAAVIGQAYAQFIPAVVLVSAGITASASFVVPFTAVIAIDTLGVALMQSFTAEAAHDESRLAELAAATARRMLLLVGAATVACLVLAPLLLAPFGVGGGAQGATILRILVLACAARAVLALYESICRLQGRTGVILVLQTLVGVGALAGGLLLGRATGAVGVAGAWVVVHLIVALGACVPLARILKGARA